MWNEFIPDLTQGASFRARLCHQPKVVNRPAWSRGWWASLSVRGERATTGLRRALSEAGEGTVLARPETQLSGRARAVVLVANDEAKRPSGSPPRHLSMPSMNSTSRVRPVRSVDDFGRGARQGAGRFRLGDVPVPCRRSRTPPAVGPWFRRNFISRCPKLQQNQTGLPNHNPKPTPAWLGGGIARSDANPHPGPLPLGR